MQIFFPLRLFALQGRHLSKVCSLGKSSEFCSLTFPIGKSFCLPFPWRKSGTNFCYCLRQFVITRQAACLRQEETLPQGPILRNFSPMIIGLNGSIFTPGCPPRLLPSLHIIHSALTANPKTTENRSWFTATHTTFLVHTNSLFTT